MQGFSRRPSITVNLTHGDESLSVRLVAPPLGYFSTLGMLLPEPAEAAKQPRRNQRLLFLALAMAMGDQLSATSPAAGAGAGEWEAYADSVGAELDAAGLVDGDLARLEAAVLSLREKGADGPKG
jgi:hypothetical protein